MIAATHDRLRKYFHRRKIAYSRVFDVNNVFTDEVLRDLAKFCRAHESTFHTEPRVSAMMEGRREVWLRIQENLKLSLDEIYTLHKVADKKGDE